MYITEKTSDGFFDLPVNLPSTTLEAGDWLIVSFVRVKYGSMAKLRLLQLALGAASTGTGTVSLGLYLNFDPSVAPWLQTDNWVGGQPPLFLSTPYDCAASVASRDLYSPISMLAPGTYSIVIGYNASSGAAEVQALGQIRFITDSVFKLVVTDPNLLGPIPTPTRVRL